MRSAEAASSDGKGGIAAEADHRVGPVLAVERAWPGRVRAITERDAP